MFVLKMFFESLSPVGHPSEMFQFGWRVMEVENRPLYQRFFTWAFYVNQIALGNPPPRRDCKTSQKSPFKFHIISGGQDSV
jgi:hypothetical protein